MKARGSFTVADWQQADLPDAWSGKRVAKIDAVFEVTGEINGRLLVAYLMHYSDVETEDQHDVTARYTGYLAFEGSIKGKTGTLILQDCGEYANSLPASSLTVVAGSGSGELAGTEGSGSYFAQDGGMVIELELEQRLPRER